MMQVLEIRGVLFRTPANQVGRKGKGTQVGTNEKLEKKLGDMREHYREWKEGKDEVVRDGGKGREERREKRG